MALPQIALPYRLYFLYFEPLAAFIGSIAAITHPNLILRGTTPLSLHNLASAAPNPLTQLLVTNISALYLLFAWNQAVVLRVATDINIWRALLIGMILSDAGHLYALFSADSEAFFGVWKWGVEEWVNGGTLWLGMGLRFAFLAGVGVKRRKA